MGITQQIGASSIIKPGVCTSATRPASPYEGQVIFETDTDKMLVWNGSSWVIPNQTTTNPEGLEIVASGSLSSTGTNISGCFSSTYDNYRIVLAFSTAPQNLYIRMRTTSDETGSVYNYGRWYVRLSDAANGIIASGNDTKMIAAALNTGYSAGLIYDITSPYLARTTNIMSMPYMETNPTTSSAYAGWSTGSVLTTTQYTGITLYPNTGTFTGEYRVYGYRNS